MAKRTSTNSPMQVSSSGQTLQIVAQYPFLNDILSDDESITVEDKGNANPPYINLKIEIAADASTASVFQIEQTEEGTHKLKLTNGVSDGLLLIVSSNLSVLPPATGNAVLITNADGTISWLSASDSNAVLGVKNGAWFWFPVTDCDNACS